MKKHQSGTFEIHRTSPLDFCLFSKRYDLIHQCFRYFELEKFLIAFNLDGSEYLKMREDLEKFYLDWLEQKSNDEFGNIPNKRMLMVVMMYEDAEEINVFLTRSDLPLVLEIPGNSYIYQIK